MQQNQLPAEPDQWPQGDLELPEEYDDKGPFDRFAEAFTAPYEAFYGLESSPRRTSIIVWGMVLGAIVMLFATLLFTAHPTLSDSVLEKQVAAIEKKYEAGDLTEEERDQSIKYMESAMSGEGIMKYITLASAPVVSVIGWSLAGLLLYGIARALARDDRTVDYSTSLAAYMIALMIPLLEKVVYTIGMYLTGDIGFSLDLNTLVRSEDALVRFALGLLGPFTLWWFFVIGTGISSISGGSRNSAIGIWALVYALLGGALVALGTVFGGA